MNVIAIPKDITKGEELIIISRGLYEKLLRVFRKHTLTSTESKLDAGLREALEDVKKGRVYGPFSSLNEGFEVLKKQAK